MFWGVTPALDLQEQLFKVVPDFREKQTLNLLVLGSCDARHHIKTIAQAYRHDDRKLNLYTVEGCPDLMARELLLLAMALEKTTCTGLLEKTRRFLEIYGNTLLRTSTARYVTAKAKQMTKLITDAKFMEECLPINIEEVKFKERDYMESLYSFWTTGSTNNIFDICKLWDHRLRQSLLTRYDSRQGVFDWDFHMRVKEVAKQICSNEYKHFREHGVAFTWLETEVCRPNVSLAAGVFKSGERYLHSGYLGDVSVSPFIAFGLDCEDEEMLKTSNNVNYKRATDVSERNVMRMFYEIENKTKFCAEECAGDTDHNLGMVVLTNIDAKMSEDCTERPLLLPDERTIHLNKDSTRINFLSLSNLQHIALKSEYANFFDLIYIGNNTINRCDSTIFNMIQKGGLVLFESRKYLVSLKRDEVKSFGGTISDLATGVGLNPFAQFDPQNDDYAFYTA